MREERVQTVLFITCMMKGYYHK